MKSYIYKLSLVILSCYLLVKCFTIQDVSIDSGALSEFSNGAANNWWILFLVTQTLIIFRLPTTYRISEVTMYTSIISLLVVAATDNTIHNIAAVTFFIVHSVLIASISGAKVAANILIISLGSFLISSGYALFEITYFSLSIFHNLNIKQNAEQSEEIKERPKKPPRVYR